MRRSANILVDVTNTMEELNELRDRGIVTLDLEIDPLARAVPFLGKILRSSLLPCKCFPID